MTVDVRFCYQDENNALNTTHSFIFYNMFRPFVSAVIRKNHDNKWKSVLWKSFAVKTLKVHKLTIIRYNVLRYIQCS